jgi:peptidoglycan/xylan/chitin deacetylase (PgdA/CDA1 family)
VATYTVTMALLASLWLWLLSGPVWAASASVVYRGPTEAKLIALTFDDNTTVTPALATLRALEKDKVPATLFVIGSAVAGTPAINAEIVKGMSEGLFEVGDHSWSHPVLKGLSDPRDWAGGSASSIASHVISHAHKGAIVVMHLSAQHTAGAIHTIVSTLRARGYEFVNVSTMLKGERLFLDVDGGSQAGTAIARLVRLGFMSGYDGNYFGPADAITRAQVAKVATLVAGLHTPQVDEGRPASYADVPLRRNSAGQALAYPYDFVEEASAAGLVAGAPGPDGAMVFRPNEAITRVQLAQILARMARQLKGYGSEGTAAQALPETGSGAQPAFADVPAYAAADVSLVAGLGLMSGYAGAEFRPWQGALRAQVALAMSRYLDLPALSRGN